MDAKAPLSATLELRMTPSMLAQVDAWRRNQDDIPGRSEAIRRLVAMGLDAFRVEQGEGERR